MKVYIAWDNRDEYTNVIIGIYRLQKDAENAMIKELGWNAKYDGSVEEKEVQ